MIEPILPAGGAAGAQAPAKAARPSGAPHGTSFGNVLAGKLAETSDLRFSGHALQRIERRGIEVDGATMGRLADGVARAAAKGSRDSLVLVDETAFVVSVQNRTVVTAVDKEHMREQVFTNIDSAVIA